MSRDALKKELDDAGMNIKWALGNIKKLGEKMEDPRYAAIAKEVNFMVLSWNDATDYEGKMLPAGKQLPSQQQEAEDAEFEIESPVKIEEKEEPK